MSIDLETRRFNLGLMHLGECLTTLGNVLQQGITDSNTGARGGIAAGLERAARAFRNESFTMHDASLLKYRYALYTAAKASVETNTITPELVNILQNIKAHADRGDV